MNETAAEKLANLQTLQVCAKDQEMNVSISVDEDGFYLIGNRMFTDYKSALKFIVGEK
jgi:hypothetical protein